jgi:hypothetical protein
MADQGKEQRKKGTFGDVRLEVTKRYVFPLSRKRMVQLGGIGCIVLLAYFLVDSLLLSNSFVARGPVSSNHANFESDCSKCHESFRAVSDRKCQSCHEKTGDNPGVYTIAAHYVYRSGDRTARLASAQIRHAGEEQPCSACHPDHLGRSAPITHVSDERCLVCHDVRSFNTNHPQFEFARKQQLDESSLVFTHIHHTKLVLEQKLNKSVDIVQACLYCHNPEPDGKHFKPINFDQHCAGSCHYPVAPETPSLAIADGSGKPGVETLEMIQRRRGPGTLWAFYTNPNEFRSDGGRVVKSPVYHKDPWILENLASLRKMLYPDLGLTGLLNATGNPSTGDNADMYREAVDVLRRYRAELAVRPEPEVQTELGSIDSLLKIAEQRLTDPPDGAMGSGFLPLAGNENPALTADQRNDVERFANRLTKDCQKCHRVEHASILRVTGDQRELVRAEFDHRAHIIERPYCLDCHNEIPVEQMLLGDSLSVASLKPKADAVDSAKVQNIPRIENCVHCHTPTAAANTCVTCHFMHPNKTNRANLRLFVDR